MVSGGEVWVCLVIESVEDDLYVRVGRYEIVGVEVGGFGWVVVVEGEVGVEGV